MKGCHNNKIRREYLMKKINNYKFLRIKMVNKINIQKK